MNWNDSGQDREIFFGRINYDTGAIYGSILQDTKIDWSAPVLIARHSPPAFMNLLWKEANDKYHWLSADTNTSSNDSKLYELRFNEDIDFFADLGLMYDNVNQGAGTRSNNYMYAIGRQSSDYSLKFLGIDTLDTSSQCLLTFAGAYFLDTPETYYVLPGNSDDVVIVAGAIPDSVNQVETIYMQSFCSNSIVHKTLRNPSGSSLTLFSVISKERDDQIDLLLRRNGEENYVLVKDLVTRNGGNSPSYYTLTFPKYDSLLAKSKSFVNLFG